MAAAFIYQRIAKDCRHAQRLPAATFLADAIICAAKLSALGPTAVKPTTTARSAFSVSVQAVNVARARKEAPLRRPDPTSAAMLVCLTRYLKSVERLVLK
jgi:hypothetical protein